MSAERFFLDLVAGERHNPFDILLLLFLRLLAILYSPIVRLRAWGYQKGVLHSYKLPVPVISVGNLTVGGTGKTPLVAWLAQYLVSRGKRVTILTRGYGGTLEGKVALVSDGENCFLSSSESGDEPCLLASLVPGAAVMMGSDRYRAGMAALSAVKTDLFIMDDGYQHLRLQRDLNILLLDCASPFGNGRTFPAGLLREPMSAMKRADMLVFSRCAEGVEPEKQLTPLLPSCRTRHELIGCRELNSSQRVSFDSLRTLRGMAIAGIAKPAPFFADLQKAGLTLHETIAFPDHYSFGPAAVAEISERYRAAQAEFLIMTAKDAVKLTGRAGLPQRCLVAELVLVPEDAALLGQMLEKLL